MAKLYLNKINSGEMELNDVPIEWRAEVEELLNDETHDKR